MLCFLNRKSEGVNESVWVIIAKCFHFQTVYLFPHIFINLVYVYACAAYSFSQREEALNLELALLSLVKVQYLSFSVPYEIEFYLCKILHFSTF